MARSEPQPQNVTIKHRPVFMLPSRFSSRALFGLTMVLCLLLAGYFLYTRSLVRQLERDEDALSKAYARFMVNAMNPKTGLEDPDLIRKFIQSGEDTEVLRECLSEVNNPVIVTDSTGKAIIVLSVNVPFNYPNDNPEAQARIEKVIRRMDRDNRPFPIYNPASLDVQFVIHYGDPPALVRLRVMPLYLGFLLAVFVITAFWLLRRQARTERGLIWAGMARESAHQLGTPLTSLHGWLELLKGNLQNEAEVTVKAAPATGSSDPDNSDILLGMAQDIERLSKVANRFELIGRRSSYQQLQLETVLLDTERYFQARLPKRGTRIQLKVHIEKLPPVRGNATLLEWAFENLIKNSIDALTGRGGVIEVKAIYDRERDEVDVTVSDNGPGIARDVRRHIFETGVTTKAKGWGVGLALVRRIVEENHGGRIVLTHSSQDKGATFLVCLPAAPH